MFPTENPPPDPPCSNQVPCLKSTSHEEVDLSIPKLHHHTQLPKFSIRDYVFTARSKDIKTNWPFSPKNLQLCLKHGVKDILPPFFHLDTVRNQSLKGCTVETSSSDQTTNINNFDGEPSVLKGHAVLDTSDNAQVNEKPDESSWRSGGTTDFPSTITSISQSEIESVRAASAPPTLRKPESSNRPPAKKCRLIVKFGSNSDHNSVEDIGSNCTTISETMASKVCPVCKTFSSTSNTTLNAHIDQCLSVESIPKCTVDSKIPTHRIKPRKTRLMVDIYATAPKCTLEDLDRRNGSSWATFSHLPNQETEISTEGKNLRANPVQSEDTAGDVGAVYVDASGTKVRILSKVDKPPPVPTVREDNEPKKSLKEGKRCKLLLTKKKPIAKHQKHPNLGSQSKKLRSHAAHSSQASGDHHGAEGCCENANSQTLNQEQIKTSKFVTLGRGLDSNLTGVAKTIKIKSGKHKLHATQDLLFNRDQSHSSDSAIGKSSVWKIRDSSEDPNLSPKKSEGMKKRLYEDQVSDKGESSLGRKKMRSTLVVGGISDKAERSLPRTKQRGEHLGKRSTSVCDAQTLKLPNSTGYHVSSPSNNTTEVHAGHGNNSALPSHPSLKSTRSSHAFSHKAKTFSTSRKNVSTVSQSSVAEYRFSGIKQCSGLKKSQEHFMEEVDEETVAWHSDINHHYDLTHDHVENQSRYEESTGKVWHGRSSEKLSHGMSNAQETSRGRGSMCNSQREEAITLTCSQSESQCPAYNVVEKIGYSRVDDDFRNKFYGLESAKEDVPITEDAIVAEHLNPEFHNRSKSWSFSQQSFEGYKGSFSGAEAPRGPNKPSFVHGHEMFCVEEVGNNITGNNSHGEMELNSEEVGKGEFFHEVDPISIPGPPGSYLPSPRDMGSVDFQGNSSLTTSRVQSPHDQHDLVGDSSDSPISATSTISNSGASRPDMKYSRSFISSAAHKVDDKIGPGFSGASIEPSAETVSTVPQTAGIGTERVILDGERFKVTKISLEREPLSFKNDDQPCCCQRKERISQGVVLNFHDSPLLRRRTMSSVTVPGKQIGGNLNTRSDYLDSRPVMFPISSCPSSEYGKVVPQVMKSHPGPISLKVSDVGAKSKGHCDGDSASPSASNPVLRLMGKNLMVVKKDEDATIPLGQAQPSSHNNHLTPQFPVFSGASSGNIQNHDYPLYHHMVPQYSVNFSHDPHNTVGQCVDGRLNSFRTPSQVSSAMFLNQQSGGHFAASMEPHGYKGEYSFPARQNIPKNRQTEKAMSTPDRQHRNAYSTANSMKEIIIIDDGPESEADMTANLAKFMEACTVPTPTGYDPRHVSSHSYYRAHFPSLSELPMVQNASSHAIPSRPPNTSPLRWNCTPEGSSMLQRSPFMAASPSTGHLGPSFYHSPSLS